MEQKVQDPFEWLEEIDGARQLAWVRELNDESVAELDDGEFFRPLQERFLQILDSDAKIPYVRKIGDRYYNFWRDSQHPRGIWRRTTIDEFRQSHPSWETVIDLDELAKAEQENWVWHGADVLRPDDRFCFVALSRGGADADVKREFDLETKEFVRGGFQLPEAKSHLHWRSPDGVFVGTDFGPGSLTTSGYPRIIKEWSRDEPLDCARTVFEAQTEDVLAVAYRDPTPGFEREFFVRSMTFWTSEKYVRRNGQLIRLEIPLDAKSSVHREWLFVELRSAWTLAEVVHPAGALLVIDFKEFLSGRRDFEVLFWPTERKSLAGYSSTRHFVLLNELDNVRNRLYVLSPPAGPGKTWQRRPLPGVPPQITAAVSAVDSLHSDEYFLQLDGFLSPPALSLGTAGNGSAQTLKTAPAFFETQHLEVTQHQATSTDGTLIPYFQVSPKALQADGTNPTLLYGYGGFEAAMLPGYSPLVGAGWLERGGTYVVANIRGGGEFGPAWHQAALKANRHKAFEDFAAVARDLIDRQITVPSRLGIMGGSNGGLLVGNMLIREPELFGAAVCLVPLLDMSRYHKLLAGASWIAEYGDPDIPDEWHFIRTFSPYHNLQSETKYPRTLFATSTRDDRVHPGHARKMVAKMKAQGHDVLYYENIEGGHAAAANNQQTAFIRALAFTFLWNELS